MSDAVRALYLVRARSPGGACALSRGLRDAVTSFLGCSAPPHPPPTPLPTTPKSLHAAVFEVAARTPDATALADFGPCGTLTYECFVDLIEAAVAVLREAGAAPGRSVLVASDQDGGCGACQVVALLAASACGCWVVPFDAATPAARLQSMVRDADPVVCVLDDCEVQGTLDVAVVSGRGFIRGSRAPRPPAAAAAAVNGDDIVWCAFTSGSTGVPKGVVCQHKAALLAAVSKAAEESVSASSVVALASAWNFDPCQCDIATALTAGATLSIVPYEEVLTRPVDIAAEAGATHWLSTPRLWPAEPLPASRRLRHVSLGGESMPSAVAAAWSCRLNLRNVYGVTEATGYQLCRKVDGVEGAALFGPPMLGCSAVVLCPESRAVDTESGELAVGGGQLAAGYLRCPALTALRFPHVPGVGRVHCTGDLVEVAGPSQLLYVGRRDGQVKLRGRRVDLGDVEAALAASALVHACAAATRDGLLVGYAVLRGAEAVREPAACDTTVGAALRMVMRRAVPDGMIPDVFVAVPVIPVRRGGKVDRDSLPRPAELPASTDSEPCRDGPECIVAEVWKEQLGLQALPGRDAHWGVLGGDSLTALRVVRKLRAMSLGFSYDAAEARFGDMCGPFAAAELLSRPVLREYAMHLSPHLARKESEGGAAREADAAEEGGPDGDAGHVALRAAASDGRAEVVAALLQAGCHPSGGVNRTRRGVSPLHCAANGGHREVVSLLLRAGAPEFVTTPIGAVPLHSAAAGGDPECVRMIAQSGASVRVRDFNRQTALHAAARHGHTGAVAELLDAGCEPDACDRWGRSAVHWAVLNGHQETLGVLIERGCDVNNTRTQAHKTRLEKESPLDLALRLHLGDDMVEMLMAAGARSYRSRKRV